VLLLLLLLLLLYINNNCLGNFPKKVPKEKVVPKEIHYISIRREASLKQCGVLEISVTLSSYLCDLPHCISYYYYE
jgi:hypothetical protein